MGEDVAAVRSELRQLIDDHVPPDYLGAFTDDPADLAVAQPFCRTPGGAWASCAWPGPRSGAARVRPRGSRPPSARRCGRTTSLVGAQYMGVNWVGPTIMRHGTPEQQRTHLPPIARGEVIWCQGFSEPDSGSDLASVQTAARRDGDGWFVSGQKIWTSYATMAQWCFLLARTSRGEKKQQGLTIFLVPMVGSGDRGPPDRQHGRPPPPQRGLLRRPVGDRRPTCSARSTRDGGGAGGAGLRAGRDRPLRQV